MADVELEAGTVIGGKYRLDRILGSGGMGTVWAAVDVETSVERAVKVIKDQPDDPNVRRRFLREGRAASRVQHPNVVAIVDVIEGPTPAIVMELVAGSSLRARLDREPPLTITEVVDVMTCVTSAVGTAHSLGVIHRDLKPENIFVGTDGSVKVLDFGIAKLTALDDEAVQSTGLTTGSIVGTPAYMAPEQVFAERDIDHRADIWSLGIVLYECLSGVCPTAGVNVGQVLKHVVSRPFAPVDELVPDLPGELAQLVTAMTQRERERRPADLREVQAVLDRFASRPGTSFGPPSATRPDALAATARDTTEASEALAATARANPRARGPAVARVHDRGALVSGPRRRRWRAIGAAVAGLAAVAVVSVWCLGRATSTSPLASPNSLLACPVLRASGAAEPEGWLGAAAAAIACERARVMLGGRPERVIAPAALLDLPTGPVDAFPRDPFVAVDARDRSIAAAQRRAQAYLDGSVRATNGHFEVSLELRRADGTGVATATGSGRALYEAVRAAFDGLDIPRVAHLDPATAAWARTDDVDAALAVLDLGFAFAHNAGQLADECRQFAAVGPQVHELDAEGRWLCAYTLGHAEPHVVTDASDLSEIASATRIRIDHAIHHTQKAGDVELVHRLRTREPSTHGRAMLAATESCLLGERDPAGARELAIIAVQAEPTNTDGGWCNSWEQLTTLERDTADAPASVRAMQAWQPWNSYAWLEPGYEADAPAVVALLRRAYLLSPFDTQIASTLAGSLLASGDRAAARGIALAVQTGGLPVHQVGGNLLMVRIETSEAKFGAALDRALRASELAPDDAGWLRAQRFDIAWRAFELAVLLGRGTEIADRLVARFVDPTPTPLDGNTAVVPMRIPAICAQASQPARCFARFRALRSTLPGAITSDTDAFLLGAERYVAHDYKAAAAAWRPLLAGQLVLASAMPGAMVDTFQRTGEIELADRIDTDEMKRAGELHGATLAHARAAERAINRGDRVRARELADQVIRAWSTADAVPPALDDMRRLVTRSGADR